MSEGYGDPLGGGFGPVAAGRARPSSRGWKRVLLIVVAAVAVFALGLIATAAALLVRGERQIERVTVDGIRAAGDIDGDGTVDIAELTDVLNVLVVGTDSREGLTAQERERLATGRTDGLRTDTIMLARIDPGKDTVATISFPRDLLVERCDGTTGRINAAYEIGEENGTGGPSCLVQTVSEYTDIPIQHYVAIDFSGFVEVVEVVGGVTMYLEGPLEDEKAGLDLEAGCVTLDGGDALGFVRTRRYDSDYGRIARQQRFLHELLAEVTSVGTVANVPRLFSLVDAAASSVEADEAFSLGVMRRLAVSLRGFTEERLVTRTVPADTHIVNGEYAGELPRPEAAEELFEAFQAGELLPPGPGEAEPEPTLRPGDVEPIVVLNGAGTAGLAGQAQEALTAEGFAIASAGNAESFDVATTTVRHSPELGDEAALVAEALGGAEVVRGEPGEGVQVVLGADFDPADVGLDAPATAEASERAAAAPAETPASAHTASATPEPEPTPTPTYIGAQSHDVDC